MRRKKTQQGFTLLEMIVSIGIFSVVIITTIGIIISVSNAQLKVASIQSTQDNIRFSIELLTKELNTGANYSTASPVCGGIGSEIRFDATSGRRVYFWDSTNLRIMRAKQDITSADCSGATGKVVQFTASDVFIDRLNFVVRGNTLGSSDGQPIVTITLRTRSKTTKVSLQSIMDIQMTIVQRIRDNTP